MRNRYQNGSLQEVSNSYVALIWEGGRRRKITLGRIGKMSKAAAKRKLAGILAPINNRELSPSQICTLSVFMGNYRHKPGCLGVSFGAASHTDS